MRNYVIINGVSSLTIPGLAIRELPAISKTLMRNQKEEIDGRDGDIITELGYSAYDKTMTIGLYGSYDINQIIAFFNQKGTIVFSDEADKYYNFTILEKIDYDKLVKFRTASVRMHCQPFKYPVSETPVEIEAEYVTATGEDITLNNTGVASLEIGLKGNTYQETTTGKQLFNKNATPSLNNSTSVTQLETGLRIIQTASGNYRYTAITLDEGNWVGRTFTLGVTIHASASNLPNVALYYGNQNTLAGQAIKNITATGATTFTIPASFPSGYTKISILLYSNTNGTGNTNDYVDYTNLMIVEGSYTSQTMPEYEPYTNGASPNPDYPQEVQVVTGDNTIKVEGKNLCNPQGHLATASSSYITASSTLITSPYTTVTIYRGVSFIAKVQANKTYVISSDISLTSNYSISIYDSLSAVTTGSNTIEHISGVTSTFTPTHDGYAVIGKIASTSGTTITWSYIQLELGNQATDFTPYQSQEYEINLGSLELCKISTYQDYLYKSGENWYKHTEIGKVAYNGTSIVDVPVSGITYKGIYNNNATPGKINSPNVGLFFEKAKYVIYGQRTENTIYENAGNVVVVGSTTDTLQNLKDKFNGGTLYYVLATPTEEQITNAELIEQLEAILNAVSYEDQTNINQENDNLAFILDVSALKKGTDMAVVNNGGNIAAKPIIAVKGNGTLGIYLDNTQMFSLNMTSDITIDTENMEAYDPNTNQLRNRQVTGDYSKFALQPGNNTIKVTGDFTSVTISKYKRWL